MSGAGDSPSTGFDCSGFISYVLNHCGNGWNVGRQTANGLKNMCAIIPADAAQPGDLIFFQGTYDTPGASHVGIYVGNGMCCLVATFLMRRQHEILETAFLLFWQN